MTLVTALQTQNSKFLCGLGYLIVYKPYTGVAVNMLRRVGLLGGGGEGGGGLRHMGRWHK